MHRLRGMRCYTAGSMDRVSSQMSNDWRDFVTEKLNNFGVTTLNPCKKPIDIGNESMENRQYRQQLINEGKYDEIAKQMRTIRVIDLRMVDLSDFLIVNFEKS